MVDDWAVGEDALDWFSDCSWANGESELKRGKTKETPLRGTLGSSLRSPAEGEGNEGFPPPPDKDLESTD